MTGIWLLSTGLVLNNLSEYRKRFAYLAGFGLGTLLGMEIEKIITLGYVIVCLLIPVDHQPLISELATLGYVMTRIEGSDSFSTTVTIVFMIVPSSELGRLMGILSREYPEILYTVKEVRNIREEAKIVHKESKSRILVFFGF